MLEARLDGHAAVGERVAHGRPEVERTPAQVTALSGQARRQLAGERLDRFAHRRQLLARRVHEVHVLGKWLADASSERLGPSIRDKSPADLRLDLLFQLLDAGVVLVLEQSLLEPGELARPSPLQHRTARTGAIALARDGVARRGPRLGHEPGQNPVEIEVPKRPVEVIGATDGAPGLHGRVERNREAGNGGQHGLVAFSEGLVQHRGDLFGGDGLHATGARGRLAVALCPAGPERGAVAAEHVVLAGGELRPAK